MTPADEIRALAARALDDCRAEQQAAHDAMIRAHAYLDKHHELRALADRLGKDLDFETFLRMSPVFPG